MCVVCVLRSFSVTISGLIRSHGPVRSRCKGSGRPPRNASQSLLVGSQLSAASSPASHPHSQPLPSTLPTVPAPPQVYMESIQAVAVLKWIPKGARQQCLVKFCAIIDEVVTHNSLVAWERLLHFPSRCLHVPPRSSDGRSLATKVKAQIQEEVDPTPTKAKSRKKKKLVDQQQKEDDVLKTLGKKVASKLEDGDFKGGIRLACSDDRLAPFNPATLAALQEKHPVPHLNTAIPPTPNPIPIQVDPVSVVRAIRSFPSGSAGGSDCLRPQHLKDLLQTAGDEDSRFLQSLASFCALVMEGRVPAIVRPSFLVQSWWHWRRRQEGCARLLLAVHSSGW